MKKSTILFAIAMLLTSANAWAQNETAPFEPEGSWDDIRYDFVEETPVVDGAGVFDVDLPVRAEDAATVPVHIVQKDDQKIEKLMIIIDENPAPLAASFTFGPTMEPLDFETRIRVNQYSNVRVLALIDGQYFMNGGFVKASGGCSAPATKDPEAALKEMGQMKLREFDDAQTGAVSKPERSAQLMIRHPNYSGLQRDQITQLFVPAMFISNLEVSQGDDPLFIMEGGISISENPIFRFNYQDNGATTISVNATDTDGNAFEEIFDKAALDG